MAKYKHTGSIHTFRKEPEPDFSGFWAGLVGIALIILLLAHCSH